MKKFLLPLIFISSAVQSFAQSNTLEYHTTPAPARIVAKELIELNPGFSWDGTDGQTRVMELDWGLITDLATQQVGHNGQTGGYQPTVETTSTELIPSLLPGAIPAQFAVAENGSATYTIPIDVAPGTNGVVPQLAVVYNSSNGFGLMGHGFTLSGLSAIVRTPNTSYRNDFAQPVVFNHTDQLVLDGKYLIRTSSTSNDYVPEISSGSTFIVSVNGTSGFKVKYTDGSVAEYGSTETSRINNSTSNTYAYYITKYTSVEGFYITYHYRNDNGNILIDRIKYTGSNGQGGCSAFAEYNDVVFAYSTAKETRSNYIFGAPRNNNQIISQIYSYTNGQLYRSYWFDYTIGYNTTLLQQVTYRSSDGSMMNPTMFKWNLPSTNDLYKVNTFASPLPVFVSTTPSSYGYVEIKLSEHRSLFKKMYSGVGTSLIESGGYVPCTYNNDVYADLLKITTIDNQKYLRFYQGSPTGFSKVGADLPLGTNYNAETSTILSGDYNGDGYADMMTFSVATDCDSTLRGSCNGPLKVLKYSPVIFYGSSAGFTTWTGTPYDLRNSVTSPWDKDYYLNKYSIGSSQCQGYYNRGVYPEVIPSEVLSGDFNGDGKTDVLMNCNIRALGGQSPNTKYVTNVTSQRACLAYINEQWDEVGGILVDPNDYGITFIRTYDLYGSRAIDINSDGRTEIVFRSGKIADVYIADYDGKTIVEIENERDYFNRVDAVVRRVPNLEYVDINSDGLIDVAWIENNAVNYALNTNNGNFTAPMVYCPLKISDRNIIDKFDGPISICNSQNHTFTIDGQTKDWPSMGSSVNASDRKGTVTSFTFVDTNGDGFLECVFNTVEELQSLTITRKIQTEYVYDSSTGIYQFVPFDCISSIPFGNLTVSANTYIASLGTLTKINTGEAILSMGDFSGDGDVELLTKSGLFKFNNKADITVNTITEGNGRKTVIDQYSSLGKIQTGSKPADLANDQVLCLKTKMKAVAQYSIFDKNVDNIEQRQSMVMLEYQAPLFHIREGYLGCVKNISTATLLNNNVVKSVNSKSYAQVSNFREYGATSLSVMLPSSSSVSVNGVTTSSSTSDYVFGTGCFKLNKTTVSNKLTGINTTTQYSYQIQSCSFYIYNSVKALSPNKITTTSGSTVNVKDFSYNSFSSVPDYEYDWVKYGSKSSMYFTANTYNGNLLAESTTSVGSQVDKKTIVRSGKVLRETSYPTNNQPLVTVTTFDDKLRYPVNKKTTVYTNAAEAIVYETVYTYDPLGNLTSVTDPNGLTSTYQYNSFGVQVAASHPSGESINTTITGTADGGANIKATSSINGSTEQRTDSKGRTVSLSQPGYNNLQLKLINTFNDASSSETLGSLSSSQTTENTYDEYGRIQRSTSPYSKATYSYTGLTSSVTDNAVTYTSTRNTGGLLEKYNNSAWGDITFSSFDAYGNPEKTDVLGVPSASTFSNGQQTSLTDPSAGTSAMEYNADGTLKKATDGAGTAFDTKYDNAGRVLSSSWPTGSITNTYDTFKGKISKQAISYSSGAVTASTEYVYDRLGRTTEVKETFQGTPFNVVYDYNANGTVKSKTYPNGLKLVYGYSTDNTSINKITFNNIVVWSLESTDGTYGRITKSLRGNGTICETQYSNKGEIVGMQVKKGTENLRSFAYIYDILTGNLTTQTVTSNKVPTWQESYEYDSRDQLNKINGEEVAYDKYGNLLRMPGYAAMRYGNDPAIKSPYATAQIALTGTYPMTGTATLSYTPWRKIESVTDADVSTGNAATATFAYGADLQRRSTKITAFGKSYERQYFGDYEREICGSQTYEYCYISSPEGLCAVFVCPAGNVAAGKMYYLHTDRQGTVHTVTDQAGNIATGSELPLVSGLPALSYKGVTGTDLQAFNTSAWGIRTWAQSGTQNGKLVRSGCITDRGYTGHEHLYHLALINMNGRMYDPFQGRFLSPDPYVQDPLNPLNHNRYAYCLNNPTKYTDPSGEVWHILIGAAVGGVINLAMTWNSCDGFWEHLAAFGIGAGAGALTAATGGAAAGTFMASTGAALGAAAIGGAATSATNSLISQTGKNFSGPVNWGQVGMNSAVGAVAGIASYGAGQWAGANLGGSFNAAAGIKSPVLSQGISGMVGGAAGGAAAGFTAGYLLSGFDLEAGVDGAVNGMVTGAAIGGAAGATGGYLSAKAEGRSPWTGEKSHITPKSVGARGRAVDVKKLNLDYLEKNGLDAHSIKYEYLGNKAPISRYDLYQTSSGQIIILPKGGSGEPIYTGYLLP